MEPLLAFKKIFFSNTAIYISEDFIDVAEADTVFGGMKISSLNRFPIANARSSLSSDINTEIDKIITKLFPGDDDKPYRIALNVKNSQLILRQFAIRSVPKKEIAQAVTFEAQKYIPSLVDSLTYGFKAHPGRPGLKEIVFAAAETKSIREMTDYFAEHGIVASTIEPVPMLLAGSLALKRSLNKDRAYIFIHYEPHNRVILCEISHNYPFFFRELSILPDEERKTGDAMSYPTLKTIWPHIEKEVSGGIDYLKKETKQKVEEIFISGFESSADDEIISQEFGVPFTRPDLSFFKGMDDVIKSRHLPVLMLLRDLQKKPLLNIAPEDAIKNDLWVLKSVAAKSLAVFFVILLAHFFLIAANGRIANKIAKVKVDSHIQSDISLDASKIDISNYEKNIIVKTNLIKMFVDNKYCLTDKLTQLNDILPPECWMNSISYSNAISQEAAESGLIIKGSIFAHGANDAADPNKILETIKQDKIIMSGFKTAELASVSKKKDLREEIVEFEILLK